MLLSAIISIILCSQHSQSLENMALRKPIFEDQKWRGSEKWTGENGVDGRYDNRSAHGGQCVISENGARRATWRVDLGDVVSISYIDIYYRTGNKPHGFSQRLAGFFLYVSNTTRKEDGHLCFHEIQPENNKPSDDQSIPCSVHGRYVIYYNERVPGVSYPSYFSDYAFYELCELEVYGCRNNSYYGEECNTPCPENCQERRCDINTGNCLGCVPGYQGPTCNQVCARQTYGLECSEFCGNCSNGETCHHVNGTCLRGCNEGVQGQQCKNECKEGSYGKNCMYNCSSNCIQTSKCDRFSGSCYGGCIDGWDGSRCTEICQNGKFGSNCIQSCGKCKGGSQCHHVNGSCFNGCSPGYNGTLCKDECAETFFGDNCAESCPSNCVNQTCHHVTGECRGYIQPLGNTDSDKMEAIPIIGGAIAAVAVLTIVIVSIIIYKRRGRRNDSDAKTTKHKTKQKASLNLKSGFSNIYQNSAIEEENAAGGAHKATSSTNSRRQFHDNDIDIDEKIHEENPYGDFYVNEETIPDIDVKNLSKLIKENSENEDDGFKKEYATLLYGERCPCDIGKQPENRIKNRFKTTFPYDHSRVTLANTKEDYINANYIDGLRDKRKYIASQGPKQITLTDFWQMIYQENIHQIVMLTNLQEGTRNKCAQYWPEKCKKTTFGSFVLCTDEQNTCAHYVIRRIKLSHRKLNVSRIITQYHYTAWPDHGTPDPICLLMYHNHVIRTKEPEHNGAILVHCSAGIGRTGTFIAIDELGETLQKSRKINIAEYVKKMRENRMNMVQTYEQYKTIFLVLHEMCKAQVNPKIPTDFLKCLETGAQDKPVNSSALRKEFQMLLFVRPQYFESDYKMSSQNGELSSSIRPLDKYVLYLTTSVPKRGSYINAISVPSYTSPTTFIITKYPAPEDAVDLLRLSIDQESQVIVCLDPLHHIESAGKWLPKSKSDSHKRVPPFSISRLEEHGGEVKCSKICIVQEESGKQQWSIDIVEPASDLIIDHPNTVLQVLKLVTFVGNIETEAPIIVISRDGASLCGVFCAVYNAIQQLTMDNEVDVFSIVRQLQIRRPELCSNLQEYKLVHEVLKTFIESRESQEVENIYYNQ
uniref:protein-tyrosine-phosphatase n=1 Tax=Crassostrea virginica TaxID=6565 RepID=A0A8B8C7W6_CRAVI|nr:receptor-type tyrosine-protein phosphatase T-like [Crassostrea virginica]XP_022311823.1 receptor-type tyrosine-protein phosphatase T-like [Crassostrea virginica]XP_022311824.1 receptor-type tyrosine-protein phosphatase T-like [Crassostrea virginica]